MAIKQLSGNSLNINGKMDQVVRFVTDNQLMDKKIWRAYIDVFSTLEDSNDLWWRGEFWGKQMRGACITYMYTQDE